MRKHQSHGLGRSGGGGDDGKRRGARPAQVFVRQVQDALIVGVGVNGGHGALLDAEVLVQNLGSGGQAVGGAGCVGNDVVFGRIVILFIHAQHDGNVFILGRRRDNHFLHRTTKVLFGIFGGPEKPGAFHHHLHTQRRPVDLGRVLDLENFNLLPANRDGVFAAGDVDAEVPHHRVILQQVSQSFGVRNIVDCNNLNVWVVERGTKNIAANPTKTVDTYLHCHNNPLKRIFSHLGKRTILMTAGREVKLRTSVAGHGFSAWYTGVISAEG